MPEICRFFGIIITMYVDDHFPPHFHARYAEFKVTIDIMTSQIIDGEIPTKQQRLIQAWTEIHRNELIYNWHEGQSETPNL